MTLTTYLLYLAAVAVLVLTPGPTMLMSTDRAVFAPVDEGAVQANAAHTKSPRSLFLQGWMVGASNPKALLFFSAFFPQFIDPATRWAPQFAVLATTFVAIEFSVLSLCCVFAARLAPWLRQPGRARGFNRASGSLFALMGALLLLVRRPA